VISKTPILDRFTKNQNQGQFQVTDHEVSNKTYGEWIEDNPALGPLEQVKRDMIPDKYKDVSLEKVKEKANPIKALEDQTGTDFSELPDPDNGDGNVSQSLKDLINPVPGLEGGIEDIDNIGNEVTGRIGQIGDSGGESIQGITDTVGKGAEAVTNPGSLLPSSLLSGVQPEISLDLGLGKIAKYGVLTALGYIVVKEVL
jgi:hypothetical protein